MITYLVLIAQFATEPILELDLGIPKTTIQIFQWDNKKFTYALKSDPSKKITREWPSLRKEHLDEVASAFFNNPKNEPIKFDTVNSGVQYHDLLPPFYLELCKDEKPLEFVPLSIKLRNREGGTYYLVKIDNYEKFLLLKQKDLVTPPAFSTEKGFDFKELPREAIITQFEGNLERILNLGEPSKTGGNTPFIQLSISRHRIADLPPGMSARIIGDAKINPIRFVEDLKRNLVNPIFLNPQIDNFPELKVDGRIWLASGGKLGIDLLLTNVPGSRRWELSQVMIEQVFREQQGRLRAYYSRFQSAVNKIGGVDTQSQESLNNLRKMIEVVGVSDPGIAGLVNSKSANIAAFNAALSNAAATEAMGQWRNIVVLQDTLRSTMLLLFYVEVVNACELIMEYALFHGDKLLALRLAK